MESRIHKQSVNSSTKNTHGIPIYGKQPRQLIIYERDAGEWLPNTDPAVIARTRYLAVSYRQTDFPDKQNLEEIVQGICDKCGLKAYWLDFACTGKSQEEKNQDLYRIAVVFRFADLTSIVIKGQDDNQLSEGWLSWGSRKWTLPEALLGRTFVCKIGKRLLVTMDLRSVANHAYSDDDDENVLITLYDTHGKDFLADTERVELLCKAIKSRSSGPSPSTNKTEGEFTAYPAEWVYALMGFFLHRIQPKPEKSEKEAFMELLDVNGLECDESGWERFWRTDGKEKVGIRIKGSHANDRIEDNDLPKYVAEANFDYGKTARTICEKGTREGILDEVYNWLGLGSSSAVSHTQDKPLLWLSGLAGSGKSTIAQTAARLCDDEHILGGTFFCSRYRMECSDVLNIFATIAYELGRFNADFKRRLSEIYCNDRDLQRAQPERQLRKLIIEPLRSISNMQQYVVIIDALDECFDRNQKSIILEALDQNRDNLAPLKFLITSRPEQNIKGAFLTLDLSKDTQNIDLNKVDPEQTRKDIHTFLTRRLSDLALSRGLKAWSSTEDIDTLVELANGLFIFASTTMKFLSNESAPSMKDQLGMLLSSKAPVSESPYKYLDLLYLQVFTCAFGEISDKLKNRLQIVLGSLVLSQQPFSIIGLGDFLQMSVEEIRETLHNLHSLVVVPDNDTDYIRLIHPSIHDFLTDAKRCTDPRFVVDEEAGNSAIVERCLRRLKKFASEDMEMQSYLVDPSMLKQSTLIINISNSKDATFGYALKYWIIQINKSNGQLDEAALQLMGELVSNRRLLDIFVPDKDESISIFFDIFNEFSQPIARPDIMIPLYWAATYLCKFYWPDELSRSAVSIKETRERLWTYFSYKDGLYGLDPNFPLLSVALSYLTDFLPYNDVLELKNDIKELRNSANDVQQLIMQQAIPEDNNRCSAIRESMSILHKCIRLAYGTYRDGYIPWRGDEVHVQALGTALTTWIKSLNDFRTEIHRILWISDKMKSSEPPSLAIIDAPVQNGTGMSAMITSSDATEGSITSIQVTSSRPSVPLLSLPPELPKESTSGHNAADADSHEGTIAQTTPIDLPGSSQDDFTANQASNASLIPRNSESTNECSSPDHIGLSNATAEEEVIRRGFMRVFFENFCICCRSLE